MENLETASQNEKQGNSMMQLQQQQQNSCSSGTSVKKVIPLKGLKKINPALLKNVKDAMINAVAKSKGAVPEEKNQVSVTSIPPKEKKKDNKVKIISVEKPNLNVNDLFPGLKLPVETKVIENRHTERKMPTIPIIQINDVNVDLDNNYNMGGKIKEIQKKPNRGASEAVRLALVKKLANKKLVEQAIRNKNMRTSKTIVEPPKIVESPPVVNTNDAVILNIPVVSVNNPVMLVNNPIITPPKNIIGSPQVLYSQTLSPLTPSKIDINSMPVIFDDGSSMNLPSLIVVPPTECILGPIQRTPPTPTSVKRKISFSNEPESYQDNPKTPQKTPTQKVLYTKVLKKPGIIQLTSQTNPESNCSSAESSPITPKRQKNQIKKSLEASSGTDSTKSHHAPPVLPATSNVCVSFEIEGDKTRRLCLTKVAATDTKLQNTLLQGCRKLVKSSSTPFIKIKDEKDSDDELHGFTSAEIEASKRMMESRLTYLRRNSESSVKFDLKQDETKSSNMESVSKVRLIESKEQPKVVANLKTLLKDSSLQEKLKKAVKANKKSTEMTNTSKTKICSPVITSNNNAEKKIEDSKQDSAKPLSYEIKHSPIKSVKCVSVESPKVINRSISRTRQTSNSKDSVLEVKPPEIVAQQNTPITTKKVINSINKNTPISLLDSKPTTSSTPATDVSHVKSSLLDIREKLSQSLGSQSDGNTEISSILELLKQDSLLNDFVQFAKEKMVKKDVTSNSSDVKLHQQKEDFKQIQDNSSSNRSHIKSTLHTSEKTSKNENKEDNCKELPQKIDAVPVAQKPPKKRSRARSCTSPSIYTCGACNLSIDILSWEEHLIHHNGLAWRSGIDTAIDLESDWVKIKIVKQFQEKNFIPNLKCPSCQKFYTSPNGLVNHMKKCELSSEERIQMKISCKHCMTLLNPERMTKHLESHCRVLKKQKKEEEIKETVVLTSMIDEKKETDNESMNISSDEELGNLMINDDRCSSPEAILQEKKETTENIEQIKVDKVEHISMIQDQFENLKDNSNISPLKEHKAKDSPKSSKEPLNVESSVKKPLFETTLCDKSPLKYIQSTKEHESRNESLDSDKIPAVSTNVPTTSNNLQTKDNLMKSPEVQEPVKAIPSIQRPLSVNKNNVPKIIKPKKKFTPVIVPSVKSRIKGMLSKNTNKKETVLENSDALTANSNVQKSKSSSASCNNITEEETEKQIPNEIKVDENLSKNDQKNEDSASNLHQIIPKTNIDDEKTNLSEIKTKLSSRRHRSSLNLNIDITKNEFCPKNKETKNSMVDSGPNLEEKISMKDEINFTKCSVSIESEIKNDTIIKLSEKFPENVDMSTTTSILEGKTEENEKLKDKKFDSKSPSMEFNSDYDQLIVNDERNSNKNDKSSENIIPGSSITEHKSREENCKINLEPTIETLAEKKSFNDVSEMINETPMNRNRRTCSIINRIGSPLTIEATNNLNNNKSKRRQSRLLTLSDSELDLANNISDFDSSMAEFMTENVNIEIKLIDKKRIGDEEDKLVRDIVDVSEKSNVNVEVPESNSNKIHPIESEIVMLEAVKQINPKESEKSIETEVSIPSEQKNVNEPLNSSQSDKSIVTPSQSTTKKRGRPRRTLNQTNEYSQNNNILQETSNNFEPPIEFGLLRRKAATQADQKRRLKLNLTETETSAVPVTSTPIMKTESAPRRGRKRKIDIVTNAEKHESSREVQKDLKKYNKEDNSDDEQPLSTLAVKSGKRKTSKNEDLRENPAPKKHKADTDYTCSACKQYIERKKWFKHIIIHNGLAWRIELDPPIDIENQNVRLNTMIRFQKERKLSTLQCEKCGEQKKSALGLISHTRQCGLTKEDIEKAKVACEHCKTLIMIVSLPIHLKNHCRVLKEKEAEERRKLIEKSVVEEVEREAEFNDSGRIKRRAVKKAEALLKGESTLDFNPDQYIITKKKAKINSRTINKWQNILNKGGLIGCHHSSDCPFQGKTIEDATRHQETCNLTNFIFCAVCSFRSNNREEVFDHVKASHCSGDEKKLFDGESDSDAYEAKSYKSSDSDSDGSFEGEDEESDLETPSEGDLSDVENRSRNRSRKTQHISRSNDLGVNPKHQMLRYMTYRELERSTMDTLMEFYKQNYTSNTLFTELMPKPLRIVSSVDRIKYEPFLRTSMKFSVLSADKYSPDPVSIDIKEQQWRRLALYQSHIVEDVPIIYVGGPVTSLQWIPLPESYVGPQFLAMTCKNDTKAFYPYSKIEPITSSIQIWSFEPRTNKKSSSLSHSYTIAIDFGVIWDMKLCPSGAFSEKEGRLGLLACTSNSGKVYIYALPLPTAVPKKDEDCSPMIQLDPCLILDSGITTNNVFGCRISWSRHKGHSFIAAGFSNGFVALWKVDTLSPMLRKSVAEGEILTPLAVFPAHQETITCLVFHHSSNANYLLTGSHDRKLKVFHLNDEVLYQEIFCLKCPSRISSGDWPASWISFFYASDAEFTFQRSELKVKNPNELGPVLDYGSLANISSSITDVVVNEWTDVVYFGSMSGEVFGCYRPNWLLTTGSEKIVERYIYSFTQYCKISTSVETSTNKDDEYGIAFCDLNKRKSQVFEKKIVTQNTRKDDITRFPYEKVNKISVNPNKSCHKYSAIGYESGFVRIKKNVIKDEK